MSTIKPHIIDRISLNVQSDRGDFNSQREFTEWLKNRGIPLIEKVCNEVIPVDSRWRVERLNLDLGWFRTLDLNLPTHGAEMEERLEKGLRLQLRESIAEARVRKERMPAPASSASTTPEDRIASMSGERPFHAWMFYLEFGHLPWWSAPFPPAAEWSEHLRRTLSTGDNQAQHRLQLGRLTARSASALFRLANDSRHDAAFRSLVEEQYFTQTAWTKWEALCTAEKSFLPPHSTPKARTNQELLKAGRQFIWELVLREQDRITSYVDLINQLVSAAFPDFPNWPLPDQKDLMELFGSVSAIKDVPRVDHPAHSPVQDETANARSGTTDLTLAGTEADDRDHATSPMQSDDTTSLIDEEVTGKKPLVSRKEAKDAGSLKGKVTEVTQPRTPPSKETTNLKRDDTPSEPVSAPNPASTPPDFAPALSAPGENTLTDLTKVGERFYVCDAGVVLAHPFLAPLFSELGYWQEEAFVDLVAQQRAVYLTHYLATGKLDGHEEDMLLPKLLCGWPITSEPIRLTEPLAEPELREADYLLRAVIGHWTALGETTPDGLREGFFARDGKLELHENGWLVTVERKAQDILLGRLPWGISHLDFPWREGMLRVEW